ncbi:hypothetical protein DV737_g4970, partial [Chaetothyriales sp. CBS 132003]
MRFPLSSSAALLFAASQLASAHSWIEELTLIGTNGSFVGTPGYPRANVLRTAPGFTDTSMVNLIPPDGDRAVNDILTTDLICRSSQTSQTQTDGSPRLQAPAGAAVALRYQENGHVTLPENQPGKPDNRGTNYVYGTSQSSSDDALLAIHRQWTADGTGGDGRGVLLSTLNFDDGQCFQGNNGPIGAERTAEFQVAYLWCQQDIALPSDLEVGSLYTLYWVWDWPTMPGTTGFPDGKQELYTTCIDIEIVANESVAAIPAVDNSAIQYESGQDISNAAASSQLASITNPTVVQDPETIAFTAVASGPASGQAASLSESPTTTDDSFLLEHDTTTTYVTSSFTVVPIPASTSVPATTADRAQSTLTVYEIETEYVTMTAASPAGPTVQQSPRLVPRPMSMLTKPLPHRSFSNNLVHYHFVYNLPSYIGLMNGNRNNDVEAVNRIALPMALGLRNPPHIHTSLHLPSPFNRIRGRAHSISSGGVGDAPCAILRYKQRVAAYGDYLKQAYVRDVERAVNAERSGLRDTYRRLNGDHSRPHSARPPFSRDDGEKDRGDSVSRQQRSAKDLIRLNQLQEDERMRAWVAQEDDFVLAQAKKRAAIRVKEGRARVVDWLAVLLRAADAEGGDRGAAATGGFEEIEDYELEYRDPVKLIESLKKVEECEALRKDVEGFAKTERVRRARDWWAVVGTVLRERENKLKLESGAGGARRGVDAGVQADIDNLLQAKTASELDTLEGQVRGKLEGDEVVDTDYWGELLDRVGLWKARKATEAVWREVVEKRIQQLRKEQPTADDDDLEVHRSKILKQGFIPAPSAANTLISAHPSSTKGQTSSVSTATAPTALDKLIARGVDEDEELFTAEEPTTTKPSSSSTAPSALRKPLYFNRVALGYDWNKYNQTHYSADSPPPRVVQGYKFHIFYPDLPKHTTKAPTYKIIRESGRRKGESRAAAGEEDMCIIRFSAGPPYEDIAFRIVDRDWDYSGKEGRGFKSVFQDGVLTLWFSFRKVYYRK